MAYITPSAPNVNFVLGNSYAPPSGDHVVFFMDVGGGSWFVVGGGASVRFDNYVESKLADFSVGANSAFDFFSEAQSPITADIAGSTTISAVVGLDKKAVFKGRASAAAKFALATVVHARFVSYGVGSAKFYRDHFFTCQATSSSTFEMAKVLQSDFAVAAVAGCSPKLAAVKATEAIAGALSDAYFSGSAEARPLPEFVDAVIHARVVERRVYVR